MKQNIGIAMLKQCETHVNIRYFWRKKRPF